MTSKTRLYHIDSVFFDTVTTEWKRITTKDKLIYGNVSWIYHKKDMFFFVCLFFFLEIWQRIESPDDGKQKTQYGAALIC